MMTIKFYSEEILMLLMIMLLWVTIGIWKVEMIINLNEPVNIKEVSELTLSGRGMNKDCKVELTFSKEDLIGFATNLIWLYEEIDNKKKVHFHVDPLGGEPSGNQALGFFLTPKSPSLVVEVNGMKELYNKTKEWGNYQQIHIRSGVCKKIEIKEPACDESIEEYELGLKNILKIKITNQDGEDVSRNCVQAVLKLNQDTLKKLATMLIILANNYSSNCNYLLANLKQIPIQYNMGIIFTTESPDVIIRCGDLGCVYGYIPKFGII